MDGGGVGKFDGVTVGSIDDGHAEGGNVEEDDGVTEGIVVDLKDG